VLKAQKAYTQSQGTIPSLTRRLTGGQDTAGQAYEMALTNYLGRAGSLADTQSAAQALTKVPGGTIEERLANAQNDPNFPYDLSDLDPYELEYLKLKVR
jgi:hypothetical protein